MTVLDQRQCAEALRAMHQPGAPLVLVNAWDVASAKVIEQTGAPAIATTSAGIAWSLGYPDGEHIPRDLMIESIGRIARGVSTPVTADLEAGYARTLTELVDTVRSVISAGAVGMNLEDAISTPIGSEDPLFSVATAVDRVAAARVAAKKAGVPLVINARTDVFLREVGHPATRLGRAIDRLNAYRAAGADALFAPGVWDRDTIRHLVREVSGPINVLAVPGTPSMAELAQLGVARVSLGSGALRLTLAMLARAGVALHGAGTLDPLLESPLAFASVDALMSGPAAPAA